MSRLRTIALAAALVLPAALAPLAPATGQQKITIGVSLAQDDNPFYIAMEQSVFPSVSHGRARRYAS